MDQNRPRPREFPRNLRLQHEARHHEHGEDFNCSRHRLRRPAGLERWYQPFHDPATSSDHKLRDARPERTVAFQENPVEFRSENLNLDSEPIRYTRASFRLRVTAL